MLSTFQLGDTTVVVARKDIKHVHLSVHPPSGRVTVSAPAHLSTDAIRAFAIGKLGWIRAQQGRLHAQAREAPPEYLDRESHQVWGRRCLLRIDERDAPPSVEWRHNRLVLGVRPGSDRTQHGEVLDRWYRDQVREVVAPIQDTWQKKLGVTVDRLFVQRMRTRWGSCNPTARSIRLNTDLAKKPVECLEFILVHELLHLIERHHNDRFMALMDRWMPNWQQRRALLNRLPVRHEDWMY
jgi:hypothetical protein